MGDIGNFLHDGKVLHVFALENPKEYAQLLVGINADESEFLARELNETMIWDYGITKDHINDNRLIIRINSLIHFISFNNMWIHALVFAFISFIGILFIYRAFVSFVSNKTLLFFALLLFPTVGFWGSGITKETLLLFAFGLFAFHLVQLCKHFKWIELLWLIFGISLLIFNKPHFGLIVIPLSLFVWWGIKHTFTTKHAILSSVGIILGLIILCYTPEKINLVDRVSYKQHDLINVAGGGIYFINDSSFCAFEYEYLDHFNYQADQSLIQVKKSTPGEYKLFGQKIFRPFTVEPSDQMYDVYHVMTPSETYIPTSPINHEPLQLLKNTPEALFNVFIRPLPTDEGSNFKHIVFIENLLFIGFLFWCFIKRKKLHSSEQAITYFLIVSALLILLIIGWTTPIIGAVVRYKMAAQLLLILAGFVILTPLQKLNS